MTNAFEERIRGICQSFGNDPGRMMDIVRTIQDRFGCVSSEAMDLIAAFCSTHRVEVESVVTFYAFLSRQPKGKFVIRLANDVINELHGSHRVGEAFAEEMGIGIGETTADGLFSLEHTSCIGMSDQAPAALINDVVVNHLSADRARRIVHNLRLHGDPGKLVRRLGDGNNAHGLVRSMVHNNLRKKGPVVFGKMERGDALGKALAMSPQEVIRSVKAARLRGRGGAGFPTGLKWEFTRRAEGAERFIFCNADEGEPGTFKDRVVLTERPHLMFEGMTIAGYAIGAAQGVVYLRAEYSYLRPFLEHCLEKRRELGLLGEGILGHRSFVFDIRIQMGAGAYVCGEETALLNSVEGKRGDPRNRPPFPAQSGYMGKPTVVNNVETFCCVSRILQHGAGWFSTLGSPGSSGTKLLSVSGDCQQPGVYEFPFGVTLEEVLGEAGGEDAVAVQMGGPSGALVGPQEFERTICYDDLATGGSVMVFGAERNLLDVVVNFLEFFVEESCGYCTPCRAGNLLLLEGVKRLRSGVGTPEDLEYLRELGNTIKATSRCGLGQTSPNPVLTA